MKVEVEEPTAKDFPGRFPLHFQVTLTVIDPEELPLLAGTWARHFIERKPGGNKHQIEYYTPKELASDVECRTRSQYRS